MTSLKGNQPERESTEVMCRGIQELLQKPENLIIRSPFRKGMSWLIVSSGNPRDRPMRRQSKGLSKGDDQNFNLSSRGLVQVLDISFEELK